MAMKDKDEFDLVGSFLRLWHGLYMPSIIFVTIAVIAAGFVVEWMASPKQERLPNEVQVAIIMLIATSLITVPLEIVKSRTKPPKEDDVKDVLLMALAEHLTGGVDKDELKERLGKIADDVENVP